jgi:hypothetical protein
MTGADFDERIGRLSEAVVTFKKVADDMTIVGQDLTRGMRECREEIGHFRTTIGQLEHIFRARLDDHERRLQAVESPTPEAA